MDLPTLIIREALNHNQTNEADYYNYQQADSSVPIEAFLYAFEYINKTLKKKKHKANTYYYQPSIKLLDVGSGTGGLLLKIKGAYEAYRYTHKDSLSLQTQGIEIDPLLIEISNKQQINTYHANALTYKSYRDFNIIYYYHPLRNDKLQDKLEKRIERLAKVGTIVIAILKNTHEQSKLPKNWKILKVFDRENNIIMQKIKSK